MIALIVAYSKKNRVIGANGKIPWQIPGEKTRFKNLTTQNVVIMGRKTFEEIKNPLPNRINIVLSKTKSFFAENLFTVKTFDEALSLAKSFKKDIFFAGGEQIYKKALPLCEKLFITEIFAEFSGDAFFPEVKKEDYKISLEKQDLKNGFEYFTYTKK